MNNTIEKSHVFDKEKIETASNLIIMDDVLTELLERGFSYLFKFKEKCIYCENYNIGFEDFDIIEVHSLETASAGERSVLYAVKCDKYNIKGVIINPFGTYANELSNICISKILNNEKLRFQYYN